MNDSFENSFELMRQMPHSVEAEQAVLGAILLDPSCLADVIGIVSPTYFYTDAHRILYECMLSMFNMGKNIDTITIIDALQNTDEYEKSGGNKYLLELAEFVPTATNVRQYARIVEEKAILRQLIKASQEISDMSFGGGNSVRNILDAAEQKIYNILHGKQSSDFVHVREVILDIYKQLELLASKEAKSETTTPTHYADLDSILSGGLNSSDLIILAGRPGMGKTSFAMNIAQRVAISTKKSIAVFSLEMTREQLTKRILSSLSKVEHTKLLTGDISGDEWERIGDAAALLGETNFLIDDSAGINVIEMKAKLRRVKNHLGLVVIDHLGLIGSTSRMENRVQVVSEISRQLKIMAKELNVPIITCAQLSRGPESRQGHKPMLSDLRESGSIEQDADVVMLLYREDYYNSESENPNSAICDIAKNRHGEARSINLIWRGKYTLFETVDRIHQ